MGRLTGTIAIACLLACTAGRAGAPSAPAAAPAPAPANASVEQIEACMRGNLPPEIQIRQFELVATDKTGGTRTLAGKVYARIQDGLINAMMRIDQPSDLRGASYLVKEGADDKSEEMYVYLPALQKVRRITGTMKDSSLFGTDLSYADFKQITYAFSGGKLVLEKTEPLDGRPAWVIVMKPEPAHESRFDVVRAWIDQKSCMVLKADFEQGGIVRKRFASSAKFLMQYGARWYVTEGSMEDVQEKTRTQVKITGVTSDDALADRLFNPRLFYVGG